MTPQEGNERQRSQIRFGEGRLNPESPQPPGRIAADLGTVGRLPGVAIAPKPIFVIRPEDLLVCRFSMVNLTNSTNRSGRRVLSRMKPTRPGYLLMDFQPQHIVEEAFFETAAGYPDMPPPRLPDGNTLDGNDKPVPLPQQDATWEMPIKAVVSTHSRLAFLVGDEEIEPTLEGLLAAAATLPLSIAPHARGPIRKGPPNFLEGLPPDIFSPREGLTLGARVIHAVESSRALSAARQLATRLGTDATQEVLASLSVVAESGIWKARPPWQPKTQDRPKPKAPLSTETSIELPWRLKLSPTEIGGFSHARWPVEHDGRFELWHSRLGVRLVGNDGICVDEVNARDRIVRAIWARDIDLWQDPDKMPRADGEDDRPKFCKSLNSRDRMMLVHESSDFTLKRNDQPWDPHPIQVERMLLSALGGWLRSELAVTDLPDDKYNITEWKHRATMGRDHEVKVVYSGFLYPFGHPASLVKVTERKFHPSEPGNPALLRQRLYVVVRQETLTYTSTQTINDPRAGAPNGGPGGKRLDLVMPFASVSVLTRVTPALDPAKSAANTGGYVFIPHVGMSPFQFRILATDRSGRVLEYSAPLAFMESDHNLVDPVAGSNSYDIAEVSKWYNNLDDNQRRQPLRGQKMRFAPPESPDDGSSLDTDLDVNELYFDALPLFTKISHKEPCFHPVLRQAQVVVPAMSMLAGASAPVTVSYPKHFAEMGYVNNSGAVFMAVQNQPQLDFSSQSDKTGAFVTPSFGVEWLSGKCGPGAGPVETAIAGNLSPADLFGKSTAKLFGVAPLAQLLDPADFTPPQFLGQTLDPVASLLADLTRLVQCLQGLPKAQEIVNSADKLAHSITDPKAALDISAEIDAVTNDLNGLPATIAESGLPAPVINEMAAITSRLTAQLADTTAGGVSALIKRFAQGMSLPPVVKARIHWSSKLRPWGPTPGSTVFQPQPPTQPPNEATAQIDLAVELQAPTTTEQQPTALVCCSISPFELQLIGPDPFITLQVEKIEFLQAPGKKPDVSLALKEKTDAEPVAGVVFGGPLTFVNELCRYIPSAGFSDPPYLDVTAEGIRAGFDLSVPTLAVGVMTIANLSLGAEFRVPFIDESLSFAFNFCTREHPFRMTVGLFGGGGFFGITITPQHCEILEAAFEFGAALAVDFGVASGSLECMAGIYFALKPGGCELTGYFRMRGEVDVLGLISACIELYLELTYETATKTAVGSATLTIEVEVAFFSTSASLTCEKKFKGSDSDPSFAQMMGPATPGAPRPWDEYCAAFAA